MDVIRASKLLIVAFVGSVTLWYFVTPYIVQPHPGIMEDILTRSTLSKVPIKAGSEDEISIENWTKWRVFVKRKPGEEPIVIYARTGENLSFPNKAVMSMEWRSEYEVKVNRLSDMGLSVEVEAPQWSFCRWGIYNHFEAQLVDGGRTIRIVPRFLFGLDIQTIESLYKKANDHVVSNLPIVGVFTDHPNYDRIIIQTYMNIVTLSVIFLLWANNPPETLFKPHQLKQYAIQKK